MEKVEQIIKKFQNFYGKNNIVVNGLSDDKDNNGDKIDRTEIIINGKEAVTLEAYEDGEVDVIIDDVEINRDNIPLYYEFMSDEDIIKNQDLISDVLCDRFFEIKKNIEFDSHPFKHYNVQLRKNSEASGEPLKMDFFGIKDTLKPINEYISEIKESEQYKTYIKKLDSKEDALNKIVANYEEVIEEDTLNNESRELSQDQNEDSLSNGEEKRIANFNVKTDEESEQKSKVRKNR